MGAVRRRSETRRLRLKLVQAAEMTSVLGLDFFFSLFTSFEKYRPDSLWHVLCNSAAPAIQLYSYSVIRVQLERVGGVEHSLARVNRVKCSVQFLISHGGAIKVAADDFISFLFSVNVFQNIADPFVSVEAFVAHRCWVTESCDSARLL